MVQHGSFWVQSDSKRFIKRIANSENVALNDTEKLFDFQKYASHTITLLDFLRLKRIRFDDISTAKVQNH